MPARTASVEANDDDETAFVAHRGLASRGLASARVRPRHARRRAAHADWPDRVRGRQSADGISNGAGGRGVGTDLRRSARITPPPKGPRASLSLNRRVVDTPIRSTCAGAAPATIAAMGGGADPRRNARPPHQHRNNIAGTHGAGGPGNEPGLPNALNAPGSSGDSVAPLGGNPVAPAADAGRPNARTSTLIDTRALAALKATVGNMWLLMPIAGLLVLAGFSQWGTPADTLRAAIVVVWLAALAVAVALPRLRDIVTALGVSVAIAAAALTALSFPGIQRWLLRNDAAASTGAGASATAVSSGATSPNAASSPPSSSAITTAGPLAMARDPRQS